jgi:putative transposase
MKKHTPEQIIAKLRQAEADLAQGMGIAQVCQRLGVSDNTFHRWRNQYGGMKADEAKRLKELEAENTQLKKLVAELALGKQMFQEVVQKSGDRQPTEAGGAAAVPELWGIPTPGLPTTAPAALDAKTNCPEKGGGRTAGAAYAGAGAAASALWLPTDWGPAAA